MKISSYFSFYGGEYYLKRSKIEKFGSLIDLLLLYLEETAFFLNAVAFFLLDLLNASFLSSLSATQTL